MNQDQRIRVLKMVTDIAERSPSDEAGTVTAMAGSIIADQGASIFRGLLCIGKAAELAKSIRTL